MEEGKEEALDPGLCPEGHAVLDMLVSHLASSFSLNTDMFTQILRVLRDARQSELGEQLAVVRILNRAFGARERRAMTDDGGKAGAKRQEQSSAPGMASRGLLTQVQNAKKPYLSQDYNSQWGLMKCKLCLSNPIIGEALTSDANTLVDIGIDEIYKQNLVGSIVSVFFCLSNELQNNAEVDDKRQLFLFAMLEAAGLVSFLTLGSDAQIQALLEAGFLCGAVNYLAFFPTLFRKCWDSEKQLAWEGRNAVFICLRNICLTNTVFRDVLLKYEPENGAGAGPPGCSYALRVVAATCASPSVDICMAKLLHSLIATHRPHPTLDNIKVIVHVALVVIVEHELLAEKKRLQLQPDYDHRTRLKPQDGMSPDTGGFRLQYRNSTDTESNETESNYLYSDSNESLEEGLIFEPHAAWRPGVAPGTRLLPPVLSLAFNVAEPDEVLMAYACQILMHACEYRPALECVLQPSVMSNPLFEDRHITSRHPLTSVIRLALHPNPALAYEALSVVAKIAFTGTRSNIDTLISYHAVPCLHLLLQYSLSLPPSVRARACNAIGNIACEAPKEVQVIIDSGTFPYLVTLFRRDWDYNARVEAAYAVCAAVSRASAHQVAQIIACTQYIATPRHRQSRKLREMPFYQSPFLIAGNNTMPAFMKKACKGAGGLFGLPPYSAPWAPTGTVDDSVAYVSAGACSSRAFASCYNQNIATMKQEVDLVNSQRKMFLAQIQEEKYFKGGGANSTFVLISEMLALVKDSDPTSCGSVKLCKAILRGLDNILEVGIAESQRHNLPFNLYAVMFQEALGEQKLRELLFFPEQTVAERTGHVLQKYFFCFCAPKINWGAKTRGL